MSDRSGLPMFPKKDELTRVEVALKVADVDGVEADDGGEETARRKGDERFCRKCEKEQVLVTERLPR